ncbi:hypothetical protein BJ165DRAFT_1520501 [Panaeolus papilionaceus]|nr:hypothetical protein BJ165DRAFT_1520501 [Panaeolus papilionaceus]
MAPSTVHSVPDVALPCDQYEIRKAPGGVYEKLGDNICNPLNERAYLGTGSVTINEEYCAVHRASTRDDGWKSISFHFNDDEKTPFSTILFGQCEGKNAGSRFGPIGSYYPKDNEPMNDGSSARNIISIACPSSATNTIEVAWENQTQEIARLQEVVQQKLDSPDMKGILTTTSACEVSIRVATRPIYVRNRNNDMATPSTQKPRATGKVKLTKENQHTVEIKDLTSIPTASNTQEPKIGPGKLYNVKHFPTYKGDFFQHTNSKILQHDVYDLNGNLVPPWRVHEVLKPGVLALFEGVFTVWCPPGRQPSLQFIADSIKVIGDSNNDFELPMTPDDYKKDTTRQQVLDTPKRSRAFDTFENNDSTNHDNVDSPSPTKKAKTSNTRSSKGKEKEIN